MKLLTETPCTNVKAQKTHAFITKVNKPSVIKLIGNEISLRKGLIVAFKIPKTIEAITAVGQNDSMVMPGTR